MVEPPHRSGVGFNTSIGRHSGRVHIIYGLAAHDTVRRATNGLHPGFTERSGLRVRGVVTRSAHRLRPLRRTAGAHPPIRGRLRAIEGGFPASGPAPTLAVSCEPTDSWSTFVRSRSARSRNIHLSSRSAVGRTFDTSSAPREPQANELLMGEAEPLFDLGAK